MDDVFQAAVDSLLELFGSDARIVSGSRKINVRCSPMFSSKLGNEKAGARISEFSANVIVAGSYLIGSDDIEERVKYIKSL